MPTPTLDRLSAVAERRYRRAQKVDVWKWSSYFSNGTRTPTLRQLSEMAERRCRRLQKVALYVERLNEHSLEDCLGRPRATAIYIMGGWFCHRFNTLEVVQLPLDRNANVNATSAELNCRPALQAASGRGPVGVVWLLLERNANVNAALAMWDGRTVL
jgi:hypothetical protein